MPSLARGTGGPGLGPGGPGRAGQWVRHLGPRDGRAGPAVGLGRAGNVQSLAIGTSGRAWPGGSPPPVVGGSMSVTSGHGTRRPGCRRVKVRAGDVRHLPGEAGRAWTGLGSRCGWARMSGTCHGGRADGLPSGLRGPMSGSLTTGRGPGLQWVPGQAGDVRHLPRDGGAWPAVGPGVGGRCPLLATGRAGRACCGSRGWRIDVRHLPRDGRAVPAVGPGEGGRCPSLAMGRAGRACRVSLGGRAMSVTCHGTGGPGLPWVPGWVGDIRHLPQDGRAGPAVGPGFGRAVSVTCHGRLGRACRGPGVAGDVRHFATGRAGRACRGYRWGRVMSVTCHGRAGRVCPWVPGGGGAGGCPLHLPWDGRAGPAVGPGAGGRCPSLAMGRASRACRGSLVGGGGDVPSLAMGRAVRVCRGSRAGGRCPSLAIGQASRACRGSRSGRGDVRHFCPRDGWAGPAVGPGAGGRLSFTWPWDGAGRALPSGGFPGSSCGLGVMVLSLATGRAGAGPAVGPGPGGRAGDVPSLATEWAGPPPGLPWVPRCGR
ncbi:collagen alpha-2(I) chain-like [Macrobrachium nipponense]|uniref:collagen alpha-2(I) chain-like n=1 Tax=Macrobrachium nipponense TaxID=159736 RepID=UPI0030C8A354